MSSEVYVVGTCHSGGGPQESESISQARASFIQTQTSPIRPRQLSHERRAQGEGLGLHVSHSLATPDLLTGTSTPAAISMSLHRSTAATGSVTDYLWKSLHGVMTRRTIGFRLLSSYVGESAIFPGLPMRPTKPSSAATMLSLVVQCLRILIIEPLQSSKVPVREWRRAQAQVEGSPM